MSPRTSRRISRGILLATCLLALAGCGSAPTEATGASTMTSLVSIATGETHNCALSSTGSVHCWGTNFLAQLGDGTQTARFSPVVVAGLPALTVVTTGRTHSCGLTAAGAAYCWGDNGFGSVGDGTTTLRTRPVAVVGGLSFSSLSAGGDHTCGLTASGAAWCWGDNRYGQIGNGDTTRSVAVPVPVVGAHRFSTLAGGGYHTCGVAVGEGVYCWGYAFDPQGKGGDRLQSTPLLVSSRLDFVQLSAGKWHTCGVTTTHAAYCWGLNDRGELGVGSGLAGSATPVRVSDVLSFATVSAGYAHSCGVTTNGVGYCWGDNSESQLGQENAQAGGFGFLPGVIAGDLRFTMLGAGVVHSCGLTTLGVVYCWGSNNDGELGRSDVRESAVPLRVSGQP